MVRIRLECASEGLFLVRKELDLALARLKPRRFAGLWAEALGQPPSRSHWRLQPTRCVVRSVGRRGG